MADFAWDSYPGAVGISQKRELIEKYVEYFADAERKGYGVYIHGGTAGSGKTYLAQCLAGSILEKWTEGSARMVTEGELLEMSRRKTLDGSDPLSPVLSCHVLIIDDLGEKRTDRSRLEDVIFRVIDTRYHFHRVTLVTSNYPLDALPNKRVSSRINASSAFALQLPDISVRARQAAEEKAAFLKEIGIT